MPDNDLTLAAMAEQLAKSDDYRVLRRLLPRTTFVSSGNQNTKTAILLDVETTGLDQRNDEVIELCMVKFDYLPDCHSACNIDPRTISCFPKLKACGKV